MLLQTKQVSRNMKQNLLLMLFFKASLILSNPASALKSEDSAPSTSVTKTFAMHGTRDPGKR